MTVKAGVIMVSPDTQKVLVVINRNTMNPENLKFGMPKGHREGMESVVLCAVRELQEETGLMVRVSKSDKRIVVAETTYFLVKAHSCLDPKPQDNTEIGDSRWVTWNDIMTTDCNRGLRLIRDKIRNVKSPLLKTLQELKPRKIRLNHRKPRIRQEDPYAKNLGNHQSASGSKQPKDEWERCDDTELP